VRRVILKIAHFSWEFPPVIYGGLGTYTDEITQKQVSLGNEVTVFSLNCNNSQKTYEKYDGIDIYRPRTLDLTTTFNLFADYELRSWGPNFRFFSDVISYNTISASQLINLLVRNKKEHFDIIVAHDWLGILGGMIVKQEIKAPLMFHIHSTEIGRSLGRGSHTIKDIEFEGGQSADCVITVSYAMKDELEKLGYPSEKIKVCWNGVDPAKYDPKKISEDEKKQLRRRYGINDNETVLFFIGRLVSVKGVNNLVKAMPSILEDFPNTKLIILGIGDLEWQLKELTKQLSIQENVIFRTEFVDERERIIHYAISDCVILPSTYEPFGIVCTESMSMAKPTVVGAKGTSGFREQIIPNGDDQCGIHINPHESSDIAWGVKQILKLEDKGIMMGKKARERVNELFNWDSVVKRTLDIYKEFI
jgi:glycosyltransferase involved in cell wall biosynthesis